MTKKEINEKKAMIDKIVAARLELAQIIDAATQCGMLDINGPLNEKTFLCIEAYSEIIDPSGWIDWWINECKCGKNPLRVRLEGRMRLVKNTSNIAELMLEK